MVKLSINYINMITRFFMMVGLILLQLSSYCKANNITEIHFMREKNVFCCLVGMHLYVDGFYITNIKNGHRVTLSANIGDSIRMQVFYPPLYKYKSNTFYIKKNKNQNVYLSLKYKNKGYNPFLFIQNKYPTFSIEVKQIEYEEGIEIYNNNCNFHKKKYRLDLFVPSGNVLNMGYD